MAGILNLTTSYYMMQYAYDNAGGPLGPPYKTPDWEPDDGGFNLGGSGNVSTRFDWTDPGNWALNLIYPNPDRFYLCTSAATVSTCVTTPGPVAVEYTAKAKTRNVSTSGWGRIRRITPKLKEGESRADAGGMQTAYFWFAVSFDDGTVWKVFNEATGEWDVIAYGDISTSGMRASDFASANWDEAIDSGQFKIAFHCVSRDGESPNHSAAWIGGFVIHHGRVQNGQSYVLHDFRNTDIWDDNGSSDRDDWDHYDAPAFFVNGWTELAGASSADTSVAPQGRAFIISDPEGLRLCNWINLYDFEAGPETFMAHPDVPVLTDPITDLVSSVTVDMYNDAEDTSLFDYRFAVSFNASDVNKFDSGAWGYTSDLDSAVWKVWDGLNWVVMDTGSPASLAAPGTAWPATAMTKATLESATGFQSEMEAGDGSFVIAIWMANYKSNPNLSINDAPEYWIQSISYVSAANDDDAGSTAATGAGSFDDYGRQAVRSSLTGNSGGFLMIHSDRRGEPMPARASSRLLVESYDANEDSSDPPYIIAQNVEADGTTSAYFGPPFNDSLGEKRHDIVWPKSDWAVGRLIVVYDGIGAGQWVWVRDRDPSHPRKFYLSHPLAVAPVSGDKFTVGAKPLWLVYPDVSAHPMSGDIHIGRCELEIRNRTSEELALRLEKYYPNAKNSFQVTRPGFPYATTTYEELSESRMFSRSHIYVNFNGRRLGMGIVDLVTMRDDYTIEAFNYAVTRERMPKNAG